MTVPAPMTKSLPAYSADIRSMMDVMPGVVNVSSMPVSYTHLQSLGLPQPLYSGPL